MNQMIISGIVKVLRKVWFSKLDANAKTFRDKVD